jgi:hypothetical protein
MIRYATERTAMRTAHRTGLKVGAVIATLALIPMVTGPRAQAGKLEGVGIGAGAGALIAGPIGAVIGGVVGYAVGGPDIFTSGKRYRAPKKADKKS